MKNADQGCQLRGAHQGRHVFEGGGEEGSELAPNSSSIRYRNKKDKLPFPIGISVALIAVCIILLFTMPETAYIYWLITSFITYCIYFIIMFIPTSSEKGPKKTKEEKAAGSMGTMIKKNKKLFGQMFWNVFLCDSEQLLPGAVTLFSINIFFAFYTYFIYPGSVSTYYVYLVMIQSFLIITYYWMISWRMPYSRGFSWDIQKLKLWLKGKFGTVFSDERAIRGLLTTAYIVLFGSVLLLFLTAFLVPGIDQGEAGGGICPIERADHSVHFHRPGLHLPGVARVGMARSSP